jgi:lysyl-tRNA synthetase class 1
VAFQINQDPEGIYEILKTNSQLPEDMEGLNYPELEDNLKKRFYERLNQVNNWLELYAPNFVKFQIQKTVPSVDLNPAQEGFLRDLADALENQDYNSEELHDEMYLILKKHGLKPQKAFQAIYRVVLGQKQGPRAASFLLSLDKNFLVKRLKRES